MTRLIVLSYSVLAYLAFLTSFSYLPAFMAGIGVPKTIDSGSFNSLSTAILIDTLLVALFGLQHAVMARDWFKSWLTRYVPEPMERSTFVLAASLVLGLIFWQWRPIPNIVWDVETTWVRAVIWCGFVTGLGLVLYSTFLINHFDLFGLRQAWLCYREEPYQSLTFTVRSLYEYVRHPMMLGVVMALWSVPSMSWGHLLFSTLMTGYTLLGIHMEERSLLRKLGDDYHRYREVTPMLIPFTKGSLRPASSYLQQKSLQ